MTIHLDPPKDASIFSTDSSHVLKIAPPVTRYDLYVADATVLIGGMHHGESGLENFVSVLRRAWSENKSVVLTGTHVFSPSDS